MIKTFKTEVIPTRKQREEIAKAIGTRRWVWNWAVDTYFTTLRDEGKHLSNFDMDVMLNKLRSDDPDNYGWIGDVNTMVKSEALKDFGLSIKAYGKLCKTAHRSGDADDNKAAFKGRPRFKAKKDAKQSFRVFAKKEYSLRVKSNHHFDIGWTRTYGRLVLRTKESIEFLRDAKLKTATVQVIAGKYYLSICYERTNLTARPKGTGKVGLDLGVKHACAIHDGTNSKIYDLSASVKESEKIQARHQRRLAKKQYNSKNYWKQARLVAKQYLRQTNIRQDFLDKLTTELVSTYDTIVVDDFSFKHTMNLKHTHHALYRVAPCSLKMKLEIKCAERGNTLIYVPKFTPTTQVCSCCGHRPQKKITLDVRTYICEACGFTIDRDVNAAINVYNLQV